MPIKDVSIRGEIQRAHKGHGFWSLPKDAIVGLHKGLRDKYGMDRVAAGAVGASGDSVASAHARRIMGQRIRVAEVNAAQAREMSKEGKTVYRVISENAAHQTQYLVSIDSTLKQMQHRALKSDLEDARGKVTRTRKTDQTLGGLVNKGKKTALKGATQLAEGAGEFSKENLTIGNFLKYGAAIASTGFDAFQGANKSDQWGTSKMGGALFGAIGGSNKGGFTNAVKKAVDLGTIGGMLAGPIGAIVGTVLGAVAGWLGGEELSNFINDMMDRIPEAIMKKYQGLIEQKTQDATKGVIESLHNSMDWVSDIARGIGSTISKIMSELKASVQEQFGNVLKNLGSATGMGFITDVGNKYLSDAATTRSEAAKTAAEDEQKRAEAANRAADDRNKRVAERQAAIDEKNKKNSWAEIWKSTARPDGTTTPRSTVELPGASDHASMLVNAAFNPTDINHLKEHYQKLIGTSSPEPKRVTSGSNYSSGAIKKQNSAGSGDDDLDKRLTVGQIPGSDIRIATDAANKNAGSGGSFTDQIKPEQLAAIVAKESSGIMRIKDGDGGTAVGITQMKQDALDDVNRNFNTDFTQELIKSDYRAALLAASLYLKIKMSQKKGNVKDAFGAYNGVGPKASDYANDAMNRMMQFMPNSTPASITPASPIPPKQKAVGSKIIETTAENETLKSKGNGVTSSGTPIVATTVNNTTNNRNIQMPIPTIRNDDPTVVRTTWGGILDR